MEAKVKTSEGASCKNWSARGTDENEMVGAMFNPARSDLLFSHYRCDLQLPFICCSP